ncbi:MAG: acyl carrier protein [Pseudomonadota bacterium]|nr:acyl carrier protein [Pseudomonadota bacterium]
MNDNDLQINIGIFRDAIRQAQSDAHTSVSDIELLNTKIVDLKFDSLEKLEVIMKIEDAFEVMLDEGAVSKCNAVSDLVNLVRVALQSKARA